MDFRYDSSADASMQLDHTVMMSKRGPVFIRSYDGWDFRITEIENYDTNTEDIRDAELTFEPLILGYINYGSHIAYLGRKPKRMWKQGLSYDNIKAISGHLSDDILNDPALAKCLMNDYPSMEEAFLMCNVNNMNVAFHRDLAFIGREGEEIGIEYKGDNIGALSKDLDFLVNDKYTYLKEVLEEIINENS